MNHRELGDMLTKLAAETINIQRGYFDIPKFGSIPTTKEEGEPVGEVTRVGIQEYGLAGWTDEISEHTLCMRIFKDIVYNLPTEPFVLLWRCKPEYSIEEDFMTGRRVIIT